MTVVFSVYTNIFKFIELSNGDSTIISWSWSFGDGGTSTFQHPTWSYSAPGTYDLTLTVVNDMSNADSITQHIIIHA